MTSSKLSLRIPQFEQLAGGRAQVAVYTWELGLDKSDQYSNKQPQGPSPGVVSADHVWDFPELSYPRPSQHSHRWYLQFAVDFAAKVLVQQAPELIILLLQLRNST